MANGLTESSIGSVIMLGKTGMTESGLGGAYWFSATQNGVNCRNVTYKERLRTTPKCIWGEKKNELKFRPFGCRAHMHLNKDRREKGRHTLKAVEAINLGFATDCNTSGYKLLIEGTGKKVNSNQVRFNDNLVYPYWNYNMVEQHHCRT
jgi:hypothetical protein